MGFNRSMIMELVMRLAKNLYAAEDFKLKEL